MREIVSKSKGARWGGGNIYAYVSLERRVGGRDEAMRNSPKINLGVGEGAAAGGRRAGFEIRLS